MLRCNLRVVLAEMKQTASKISKDTGISRVTLGALINNQAKGVQFDTINTLCTYLGVEPGRLFSFAPFEIAVENVSIASGEVMLRIDDAGREIACSIPADIHVETNNFERWKVPTAIFIDLCTEETRETELFMRYYRGLSQDLKTHVLDMIENATLTAVEEELPSDFPDGIIEAVQIESRVCGNV